MTPRDAYAELLRRSRERAMLASCLELLSWDELTYLPPGGVAFRGRQMAYLAGLLHTAATDPRVAECLADAEGGDLAADPHSITGVNLRRWRWTYDRLRRVPRTLVEEIAEVATISQQVWASARAHDSFAEFLPWLERILALKRSEGACLAAGGDVYDALLQDYEPGATSGELRVLFDELRFALTPIVAAHQQEGGNDTLTGRCYPIDRQRAFGRSVAAALGFDFDRGRIDTTTHPFFSPIGPGDCRITTRYSEFDFSEGFFSMLHEVGHGLYEQGLDPEQHGTPIGEAPSLGLHESQSRLWENGVGRSASFWRCFYPQLRREFPDALGDVSPEEFLRSIHRIRPGLNRVRADRATYDLHIHVRFDLERAMVRAELTPADLPQAWRERYRDLLGVEPESMRDGCLQDGHWSAGQFGYFPTYTLGNLYAAQLMEAARVAIPDLDEQFAAGDFHPLRDWLQRELYSHGQRYTAAELVTRATGRPPEVAPLVRGMTEIPTD